MRLSLHHLDSVDGATFGQLLDASDRFIVATLERSGGISPGHYVACRRGNVFDIMNVDGAVVATLQRGNLLDDCEVGGILVGAKMESFGAKRGVSGTLSAFERLIEVTRRKPFELFVD